MATDYSLTPKNVVSREDQAYSLQGVATLEGQLGGASMETFSLSLASQPPQGCPLLQILEFIWESNPKSK